ncbi:hypothetical protein GCM10022236_45240 [Microlunatus ginsengisoli]|uniref:Uncharacterized protein n=1 Tax=Microlunatus ginsengisoli TaxID=363863 RepID=A0ABP7AQ88_9ACTN
MDGHDDVDHHGDLGAVRFGPVPFGPVPFEPVLFEPVLFEPVLFGAGLIVARLVPAGPKIVRHSDRIRADRHGDHSWRADCADCGSRLCSDCDSGCDSRRVSNSRLSIRGTPVG